MIVIVCLDNKGGMLFNNRRVSQDRKVTADIIESTDKTILMSLYSKSLFIAYEDRIKVDIDFLNTANSNDYCFVETVDLQPYENKIDEIVVYKWNRDYPSDFKFSIDLNKYKLVETIEFEGYSHDKITKEIYRK